MGWEVPRRLPRNGWRMEKKIRRSGSARQSGGARDQGGAEERRRAAERRGRVWDGRRGRGIGTQRVVTRNRGREPRRAREIGGGVDCGDWQSHGRVKPRERMVLPTGFFLHFILFSSRD
jgi:hypothetical protein